MPKFNVVGTAHYAGGFDLEVDADSADAARAKAERMVEDEAENIGNKTQQDAELQEVCIQECRRIGGAEPPLQDAAPVDLLRDALGRAWTHCSRSLEIAEQDEDPSEDLEQMRQDLALIEKAQELLAKGNDF